jgi:hypothetical protein
MVLLCVLGIVTNAFLFGPALQLTLRGVTDFMDLYAGGRLAFSNYLYDTAHVLQVEAATEGSFSPTRLFMRLPYYAMMFWPLAHLPYPLASAIWEVLCVASLAGFAVLWPAPKRWTVVLACCWSLPMFMTVAEGQDIGLLLLWIALSALLQRKQKPAAAGLIISLCAAKFHLFLLLPLWIIGNRLWRFGAGLVQGGITLLVLSFFNGGLDWPPRYYRFLRVPGNNPYAELMPNLHGFFATWQHAAGWEMLSTAVIAVLVWLAVRNGNTEYGFAAVLVGGLLTAPHDYMADCALMVPAALAVLSGSKIGHLRLLSVFLLTPILYLCLILHFALPIQAAFVLFLCMLARKIPSAMPDVKPLMEIQAQALGMPS